MSYALLILIAFFFLLPSAFRAARLSLGEKENDVKDWLPADFAETAELEWFANHFAGEAFVLATWEGCSSEDQRLKLLSTKLRHESEEYDPSKHFPADLAKAFLRARDTAKELQLLLASEDLNNWGGEKEKWLRSASGQWYYIKPDGGLYRWDEALNAPSATIRKIKRARGTYQLSGTLVTAFGSPPDPASNSPTVNPFYNDPSLLTAPLFETVQTGYDIVETLAHEGGPLWPIDMTDPAKRPIVARRLAMERLTGMLFAPAVPREFDWTPAAFAQTLDQQSRTALGEDFDFIVSSRVQQIVDRDFDGSIDKLASAPDEEQAHAWYEVWDASGTEPPPRLTCVLVTLTDLAKDNLVYAIGRGVLGQPRGRLLELADQSGVYAARPPAMAPPPFNREPAIATATMPALRMGGPTVDNMAIDEEGSVTLVRLVGYSVLLGVVLSYLCFRSIKITVMIFIVGGSAAMLSMAMVWWTGGRVDAILMSMPSLVYVLGLSGAIHVINYYRDEVRARGQAGAAGRALRHAALPCTLASFTTAIGLISLFTSNLKPISGFGLYSAVGVMATLGILFSYLPAALATFQPKVDDAPESDSVNPGQPRVESKLSEWWAGVGRSIAKHHAVVTIGCLVFFVACGVGMRHIKTSVQLLELFDPGARIIRDYAWMEDNFGKLVPMEVVVRMPTNIQAEMLDGENETAASTALTMLERVEAVSRIRKVVHRTLGQPGQGVVGQATAADTFLPDLPDPSNGYSPVRAKFTRELAAASDQLRANDYLRIEKSGEFKNSELWRISLRVAALSDVDYGQFISTLRDSVSPVLSAYQTRGEIVAALSKDGKLDSGAKLMIVGAGKPDSLDDMTLVGEDGVTLISRNAYVATLGELLANERMESPRWLNLSPEKAAELIASDRWQQLLESFDAVLWLGGEGYAEKDFQFASNLIDARDAESRVSPPMLLPDRTPTVEGDPPIQAIYTGVIPVVYKAQRTLLTSLADSIALAFVLIAIVMIILLNPGNGPAQWIQPKNFVYGAAAGIVAMVPNIFPVVVVFGVMCHMGVEIDIGTMMTASVAMGVAVDDTIHYLAWFRDNLDSGKSRVEAVIETYRRVGPAMTQTTVVGGLGLFVFALSTFTPTQRFGTLMLVMLMAALVGDLILLPALLAGPLGRFFKPRLAADGTPTKNVASFEQPGAPPESSVELSPETALELSAVPHLKVHFPDQRKDAGHPVRRK
jgi:predicted RND superfamily exporter protein